MLESYIELLNQTFSDPTSVSPDKLKVLVEETMRLFGEIREKFRSKEPRDREEAMHLSLEMKKALEMQMENISKLTGIDPSQFGALSEANLDKEELALVNDIKKQLRTAAPETSEVQHKKKMATAKVMG